MENYFEDDEITNDFEHFVKWEVVINNQSLDKFINKEEAIDALLEEIDFLSNDRFSKDLTSLTEELLGETILNMDELTEFLMEMNVVDFYNFIEGVLDNLYLGVSVKLINLDQDEPEFGEL